MNTSTPTRRRSLRIAFIVGLTSAAALAVTAVGAGAGGALASSSAPPGGASAQVPQIVPKPVSMTMGSGSFAITPGTQIVAASPQAAPVAADLAGYLRPATGYRLPVVSAASAPGAITLVTGPQGAVAGDPDGEGYRLNVTPGTVRLSAVTAHGLYNGIQTIRQLLPVWIDSPSAMPGPWTMPAVNISDYPRYTYRGVMLDI